MEAKHWGGLVYYTEWSRLLLKKRSCFFSFNYALVRPRYYTGVVPVALAHELGTGATPV